MSGHYSIGDVLDLLQHEFPDVTISKIRFLESQGLLSPQRTPSGYRKFFAEDVGRLRRILIQQRDSFFPLREIKVRLEAGGGPSTEELVEVWSHPEPAPSNQVKTGVPVAKGASESVGNAPPPEGLLGEGEGNEALLESEAKPQNCLLYTSPSPRDATLSRMPSSA